MAAQQLPAALDLMRRLPPRALRENLASAVALVPDLIEDLLSSVDQPLEVMRCPDTQKEFILCDYNRDGDSYRSPWSNKYTPPIEDEGVTPSDELRRLELTANDAFDQYREQYYEGGVSSCYFWDNEGGFACCVVIRKDAQPKAHLTSEDADPNTAKVSSGIWNSIHVIEANVNEGDKRAKYKLTTTIMLSLDTACKAEGSSADLSGNLTRAMEKEKAYNPADLITHISNIGEMIEEMEGRMRSTLEEVYFGKTKEVVAKVREGQDERKVQQQSLMAEMAARRNG